MEQADRKGSSGQNRAQNTYGKTGKKRDAVDSSRPRNYMPIARCGNCLGWLPRNPGVAHVCQAVQSMGTYHSGDGVQFDPDLDQVSERKQYGLSEWRG